MSSGKYLRFRTSTKILKRSGVFEKVSLFFNRNQRFFVVRKHYYNNIMF